MKAHRQQQRYKKEVKMVQKPTAKLMAWKAFTRFVQVIARRKSALQMKNRRKKSLTI